MHNTLTEYLIKLLLVIALAGIVLNSIGREVADSLAAKITSATTQVDLLQ